MAGVIHKKVGPAKCACLPVGREFGIITFVGSLCGGIGVG
jgi:hypothetical protein